MDTGDPNFQLPPIKDEDMRYFPRWEVSNRASYLLDGETDPCDGETKDISCAGACISGLREVLPDQKLNVTIELTKDVKIQLKATVLWVKSEGGSPVMGLAFEDTPDEVQELLLDHAFEVDYDKIVDQMSHTEDESQESKDSDEEPTP